MLNSMVLMVLILTINAHPSSHDSSGEIKITGGSKVVITDFPFQVAVIQFDRLWCGGSIISLQSVLTAAHCVIYATSPLSIHAGTSFWAQPGSVHQVDHNITYGSEKNTDVAVLHIINAFDFDETRQPIPISLREDVLTPGTMANITGWGITTEGFISDQLMVVQVPISDRHTCNSSYSGMIHEGQFCAGTSLKDSCTYDSGGPLIIDGKQAGIISMGSGCGNPIYPGIYVDVAYFSDWIIKQSANDR